MQFLLINLLPLDTVGCVVEKTHPPLPRRKSYWVHYTQQQILLGFYLKLHIVFLYWYFICICKDQDKGDFTVAVAAAARQPRPADILITLPRGKHDTSPAQLTWIQLFLRHTTATVCKWAVSCRAATRLPLWSHLKCDG